MADPILHHDLVRASPEAHPAQWLYVLHGMFGAGRNWSTIMRRVVHRRPEWGAVLVDLREHGRSSGFAPPHTVSATAADLMRLVQATSLPPAAVLGHSFGGKVALEFARASAADPAAEGTPLGREDAIPRELWIIDSVPAPAPEPRGAAWAMLRILQRHAGPFADRAEAIAAMEADGVEDGVAQWMSTNLQPTPQGDMRWRIDLPAMEALLRDFFRADLWDVVEHPPGVLRIHFVKAEQSDVMPEAVTERIERIGRENRRVELIRMPGGHWLNADNPDGMVALLAERLAGESADGPQEARGAGAPAGEPAQWSGTVADPGTALSPAARRHLAEDLIARGPGDVRDALAAAAAADYRALARAAGALAESAATLGLGELAAAAHALTQAARAGELELGERLVALTLAWDRARPVLEQQSRRGA